MHDKLKNIMKQVREFPLENCGPSDDPDKQYCYVQNFKIQTTKLKIWLDQIKNEYVENFIAHIDWDFECITDAHQTKIKLDAIFDYIEEIEISDYHIILDNFKISLNKSDEIMKFKEEIIEFLYPKSAEELPIICQSLGLAAGEKDEAYSSKKAYIRKRLIPLKTSEMLLFLQNLRMQYPESEFSEKIEKLLETNSLKIKNNFDEILNLISNELKKAKYTIWVAVAWFTNRELLKIIYDKQNQGINVQIIIDDNDINKNAFKKDISEEFEVYKDNSNKLMHNKFCIIDLKKVIIGSYNWTNKANYNNESISLIEDTFTAENYADNFVKLKTQIKKMRL